MSCRMKKIGFSRVRNQAILHEIALIIDAMSAMNMVTLSYTVLKKYLLQELQQLTTNLTDVTMPH